MFCIASFIVLSLLGIFSATHRKLARDAWECVFRRVRLQPCDTGFDTKIKSKLLSKVMGKAPGLAKWLNKHFELLAWVFVILMIVSTVWFLRGIYFYYAYGSCNGLNQGGFCVFDPSGSNNQVSGTSTECRLNPPSEADLTLEPVHLDDYLTLNPKEEKKVVFIGCYSCEYTRKAYPLIQDLLDKEPAAYTFIHFPTKADTAYLGAYDYCVQELQPDAYFAYVDELFSREPEEIKDPHQLKPIFEKLGINTEALSACVNAENTKNKVDERLQAVKKTGIYGTPTIFINGKPVVGPKPYRVYRRMLTGSLF